jgi:PKD repeat protein
MKRNILYTLLLLMVQLTTTAQETEPFRNQKAQQLHPPPVVNFYITGLCYGDTTRLISKTDIGEIYWAITNDKGDTLYSSKGERAQYYFRKKGIYNVCQTADNGHLATKIRTVVVDTVTHADFYFRPCFNEFNNTSTCSDQFVWLLPDNTTVTDTFPAYTFNQAGSFPVKLIAKKGNKANTVTKMISVPTDSLGIPDATFTFRRHGSSNVFDFKATDSLEKHYSWNFGDRIFDDTSGYKVTHSFDMEKYEPPVSLRVSNGCGFRIYELDPFAITGMETFSLIRNANIFPNPVNEELTISISDLPSSEKLVMKLMDVNGSVLKENASAASGSFSLTWNVSAFAKGIYFLQIIAKDQVMNKKVVVQ